MIQPLGGFSDAHNAFLAIYRSDKVTPVEFSDTWNNGTGYFDKLVKADLGLVVGTRFKSLTEGNNNRRIIGIVTPFGNVVFFERYTAGASGIITSNVPRTLSQLIPSGSASESLINTTLLHDTSNIVHTIDDIITAAMRLGYSAQTSGNEGDDDSTPDQFVEVKEHYLKLTHRLFVRNGTTPPSPLSLKHWEGVTTDFYLIPVE